MSAVHEKTLVVDGITPVGAYAQLRRDAGEGSFLLESVVPGERWGRYSVLGYRPQSSVLIHGAVGVDPFAELARLLPIDAEGETSVAERFCRAHVGAVLYDAIHFTTKVEPWPAHLASQPVVARLVSDCTVIVFDNSSHTATIAAPDQASLQHAEAALARSAALRPLGVPDPGRLPSNVDVDISDAEYERVVSTAKEHVLAGDAFQVVAARTFSVPAAGADIFDVYRALRVLSPAPYMYLFELPAREGLEPLTVAGASPETLVRLESGRVTLRPIAGTRRRGRSDAEDDALAAEMLADPKERAEHVMLIDLARNDVGRVAKAGTVTLNQTMAVERFSHVMHIVSEVTGELAVGRGPWDVLRATFPAGTLTGAPKVRAMQILRELESRPRGVYGGALGYVTRGGDLDFAIAIRTAVLRDGRFEVSAGAGVVADSVPALEAKETRNKARAALAAIAEATRRAGARG
ncbi:MAG: anthranilate synthase component I family protein [Polyangiaceae bacterium]|nr:anthranilate synthase component I family protein [Polyangiaceae bacterium]